MSEDLFRGMKGFNEFSYAANALERWKSAYTLRHLDIKLHRILVIEGYAMALEQFLKFIISRTSSLTRDHIHSHKLWGLACDAQLLGREKYRKILQRFSQYYDEGRYECDDPVERQSLLDYLTDSDVLDVADTLLLELYGSAQDIERSSGIDKSVESTQTSPSRRVGRLNLML